jgi:hypothetical protein
MAGSGISVKSSHVGEEVKHDSSVVLLEIVSRRESILGPAGTQ